LADPAPAGGAVPDVVAPGLRLLICGINPGVVSGETGHHFARPGNRFWPALERAGITPRRLRPDEQHLLPALGVGVTNLVARTTAAATEVTPAELREGADRLRALVADLRPRAVAVLGMGAYRTAFRAPRAPIGRQADDLEGAALWVLPNPSGLQARYGTEEIAAGLRAAWQDATDRP
jgi:TDG/mug DNA glycosylase family protein